MKLRPLFVAVAMLGVSAQVLAEPVGAPDATSAPAATPAPAAAAAAAPAAAPTQPAAVPSTGMSAAARARAIPPTAEGLKQRYEFVGNLIERSASAQQLEKSGSPEAKQVQQQARDARSKAKDALAAGELEKADALLKDASQLMMKAVRLAHPEEASAAKHLADFNNRKESVKSLLATGKRVASEKGASKDGLVKAEGLLKEADDLAAAGKIAEGKVKIDQAYAVLKDSVREMRQGEALTADKNFATKEDEYRYEQARNDDYQGLIGGVIQDKTNDPTWAESAKKGRTLRDEADTIAKSKDFEGALKKINESTNQLKSILRRAGFPII